MKKIKARIAYIFFLYIPLLSLYYKEVFDIKYLDIVMYILYIPMISSGIFGYSNILLKELKKDEKYKKYLLEISFHPIMRLIILLPIIYILLSFNYTILTFLLLLSFGGEYTIERKVLTESK